MDPIQSIFSLKRILQDDTFRSKQQQQLAITLSVHKSLTILNWNQKKNGLAFLHNNTTFDQIILLLKILGS